MKTRAQIAFGSYQCMLIYVGREKNENQHKVELFKELSLCEKKRYIRPALRRYGVYPDRYYQLRERFMSYGVWGLVDLIHASKRVGEKISQELELQIIEERLKNPALSAGRMMDKLDLKCSRANVQKIYSRWKLSSFKDPISIHGVISTPIPEGKLKKPFIEQSAKLRFHNPAGISDLRALRLT